MLFYCDVHVTFKFFPVTFILLNDVKRIKACNLMMLATDYLYDGRYDTQ